MNNNAASRLLSRAFAQFQVFRIHCEAPGGASVTCPAAVTPPPSKTSASLRLCVKRSVLALACAGLFATAASAATAGETTAPMSPQDTNPYITFSSSLKFYVWPQVVTPGGKLYYSTNAKQWLTHTSGNMEAAIDSSGVYKLYVRGTGNRRMTDPNNPGWQITAPNPAARVDCSGNLATLLDHATVTAGQHPQMDEKCFESLFEGCTLLSSAPSPPAANLTYACCRYMFEDCTNLTNAPALPATTLANECYNSMFRGCTALTCAPELPAMNLALGCYGFMFEGCGSLTNAPALPATTLAPACYRQMFGSCGSLTKAPALPAMTLTSFCYGNMFYDCPGLTELPVLPATKLADRCYYEMFKACPGIKVYTAAPGVRWSIPSNATPEANWNYRMFDGTGGTFTGDPGIGTPYYYTPPVPFPDSDGCITFSSAGSFTVAPQEVSWNGSLYASTDTTNWMVFAINGATAANNGSGEYKLYLCGLGNRRITGSLTSSPWLITADTPVACSGNLETLLDHATVSGGEHPPMDPCCFARLFENCKRLTHAPALPATTLAGNCYDSMFYGCSGLTNAPELPATTLASGCYAYMFYGCTSLTHAPALSATALANECCWNMFKSCTGLTQAPALPATTLAPRCYLGMFSGCTSLTQAPALSATNLAESCYGYMFYGCQSLAHAPALPATNLANGCYNNMFNGCTSLTQAPVLPATTLASACYERMLYGCTGLTSAPALPAATLAPSCYNAMFIGCTGLTRVPELPAMNLAANCYYQMFRDCTNLARLPELPATNLAENCYYFMFYNCTGIVLNAGGAGMPWRIPDNATAAPDWNQMMFYRTGGTFTGNPAVGTTYYLASGLPAKPAFATDGTGFVIGDNAATIKIVNAESGIWYTVYSTDDLTQTNWTKSGNSIKATGSDVIFTIPRDPTVPRRFFKVVASLTAP